MVGRDAGVLDPLPGILVLNHHVFAKLQKARIGFDARPGNLRQVAEHLIERSVLLHDVDDVPNLRGGLPGWRNREAAIVGGQGSLG